MGQCSAFRFSGGNGVRNSNRKFKWDQSIDHYRSDIPSGLSKKAMETRQIKGSSNQAGDPRFDLVLERLPIR